MAKADSFQQPMAYTGSYIGNWNGYYFKEALGYTSGVHTGVDYNKGNGNDDLGMAAKAVANGTVVLTGNYTSKGFGNTVIIKHDLSDALARELGTSILYTRYMHLGRVDVSKNQVVGKGQQIGTVGKTGTKWAHLHLDMWKGNLGAHLEYHKDTQLQSYLDPFITIEKYKNPPGQVKGDNTMDWKQQARRVAYLLYLERGISSDEIKLSDNAKSSEDIYAEVARSGEAFRKWKDAAKKLGVSVTDSRIKEWQADWRHHAPGITLHGMTSLLIPDKDNYYNRVGIDLAKRLRGRTLSRSEFRNNLVGQTMLKAVEVLSDHAEAQKAQHWQDIGKRAVTENWEKQIEDSDAKVTELGRVIELKDKEIERLKAELAVGGSNQDTVNLNALGEALRWLVQRLGLK